MKSAGVSALNFWCWVYSAFPPDYEEDAPSNDQNEYEFFASDGIEFGDEFEILDDGAFSREYSEILTEGLFDDDSDSSNNYGFEDPEEVRKMYISRLPTIKYKHNKSQTKCWYLQRLVPIDFSKHWVFVVTIL